MADPLGLIGSTGAGAIRGIQPLRPVPAGGVPADPNAPSFKDVLLENIEKVNKLQQEATAATEDMLTGNGSVEGVMLATAKADAAFPMLLAVRNKVMAAYEEVKQIRV